MQRTYVVADPEVVRIFLPDGRVITPPRPRGPGRRR
jgi:hypothetical protein